MSYSVSSAAAVLALLQIGLEGAEDFLLLLIHSPRSLFIRHALHLLSVILKSSQHFTLSIALVLSFIGKTDTSSDHSHYVA